MRAREGAIFRNHPTFGVRGAEMKKTAEQIVHLPVSNLSIVANRSNKEADRTNSRYKATISSLIWNKEKPARFQLSLWKICRVSCRSLMYSLSPDI